MAVTAGAVQIALGLKDKNFSSGMKNAQQSADQLRTSADATVRSLNSLDKALTAAGAAAGTAAYAMINLGRRAFDVAADVSEMNVAMEAIEKSNDMAAGSISDAADAIRAQGIEMKAAQEIAVLFTQGQIDLASAAKVARVAQDLAVLSQSNSTATAQTLAYAIQTGNSRLLKSAGITKYASEAYSEYAVQLEKSVNDLTNVERQQAIVNMILEEGEKVAGTYTAAMEEPGKVLRSFPRLLNDMQLAIGEVLLSGFGPMIKAAYDATKAFSKMFRDGGVLKPVLEELSRAFEMLLEPLTQGILRLKDMINGISNAQYSVDGLAETFVNLAPIVTAATTALSLFAGKNILSRLPLVGGHLAAVIGPGAPLLTGAAILVAMQPELRAVFTNMIKSMKALAPTAKKLGEQLAKALDKATKIIVKLAEAFEGPAISAIEGFMAGALGLTEVLMPLLNVTLSLVEAITSFGPAGTVLVTTLALAKLPLGNVTQGMKAFSAGIQENIRYQKTLAAQQGITTGAVGAFGSQARISFRAAGVAVKGFLASAAPLAAMAATIGIVSAALSINRDKMQANADAANNFAAAHRNLIDALQGEGTGDLTAIELFNRLLTEADDQNLIDAKVAVAKLGLGTENLAVTLRDADEDFHSFLLSTAAAGDELVNMAAMEVAARKGLYELGNELGTARDRVDEFRESADFDEVQFDRTVKAFYDLSRLVPKFDFVESIEKSADRLIAAGEITEAGYTRILDALEAGEDLFTVFERLTQLAIVGPREFVDMTAMREFYEGLLAGEAAVIPFIEALQTMQLEEGQTTFTTTQLAEALFLSERATMRTDRAMREAAVSINSFTRGVANADKKIVTLEQLGDDLTDTIFGAVQSLREANASTEDLAAATRIAIFQFMEAATAAGYEEQAIRNLLVQLRLADELDPRIDFSIGFDVASLKKQLKVATDALMTMYLESNFVTTPAIASQQALVDSISALVDAAEEFESVGAPSFVSGASAIQSAAGGAADAVGELVNKFDELVDTMANPVLTEAEATVFAESLATRAEALALEMAAPDFEMSEAEKQLEFFGAATDIVRQIQSMVGAGLGEDQIADFVGAANANLAMLGQTIGMSDADAAAALAMIQRAEQMGVFMAQMGMTSGEDLAAFEQYIAAATSTDPEGFTPTDLAIPAAGGGSVTNVTVNLPPGVSGEDVIAAMTEYAETSGATVPAPFEFVNV